MNNTYAPRRVHAVALRQMAIEAHPHNRTHQARWIQAVRFLRRRNLWVRDGARVQWGIPGEAA